MKSASNRQVPGIAPSKTNTQAPAQCLAPAGTVGSACPSLREWLIVFVKAPVPGRVKTRLLELMSPEQACELYRCLVQDTLVAARAVADVRLVVAYAADEAAPDLSWLGAAYPMLAQQGATLGARLARAFDEAFASGAARVAIIGSDAPELSAAWISQAFEALAMHDVVLGPTADGGYHLIALTRRHPELFVGMPWSTPRLLKRTMVQAKSSQLRVHLLEPIDDLDTPDDVWRYRSRARERRGLSATARYVRSFEPEITPRRARAS